MLRVAMGQASARFSSLLKQQHAVPVTPPRQQHSALSQFCPVAVVGARVRRGAEIKTVDSRLLQLIAPAALLR